MLWRKMKHTGWERRLQRGIQFSREGVVHLQIRIGKAARSMTGRDTYQAKDSQCKGPEARHVWDDKAT